jgi:hypothetical protein
MLRGSLGGCHLLAWTLGERYIARHCKETRSAQSISFLTRSIYAGLASSFRLEILSNQSVLPNRTSGFGVKLQYCDRIDVVHNRLLVGMSHN